MFKTLKGLTKKKNKDIRKRIYFTLLCLAIFVIGTNLRVPGTKDYSSSLGFLDMLKLVGGGNLRNFSVFALGVMPYISAEIIMELMQMDIVPYFSELRKEGPVGRQKIASISRYLGILIAFIQGIAFSYMIAGKDIGPGKSIYISIVLTAGTAFLMWLGDRISQKGIGNGISLLIAAGIVYNLPSMMTQAYTSLKDKGTEGQALFAAFVVIYVLIIIAVVYVELAERRIPIQYTNKSTIFKGNDKSFMPLKVNPAGVMPVILASSFMAIPLSLSGVFKGSGFRNFASTWLDYSNSVPALILFALLIYLFSYFYNYIQIKPEELAKNLNESGGFIPGVRVGTETRDYITTLLSRLTFLGGLCLVIISTLPIIFNQITSLPQSVTLGGTGLLIVVGVALDTYKQLEGSLVAKKYYDYEEYKLR